MANGSEQFVFKPQSEKGSLAVLLPSSVSGGRVEIIDAKGNVVSTGQMSGRSNENRETFRFDRPGNQYGDNVSVRVTTGDQTYDIPVGSGSSRFEGDGLNPQGIRELPRGTGSINIGSSPGGNQFVVPGSADFGSLESPNVNFSDAFSFSQGVGEANKDIFFQNVGGEQARQTALGLIGTDVEGIKLGADQLAPVVRQAGRQDVQENISRAGLIDEANLSRIPGFNAFNAQQARQSQEQAQELTDEAVDASGLDFRGRINKLISNLSIQAEGKLSPELDKQLTTESRNRAADLSSSAGISSISGAGVRASDRLLIGERLDIQRNAQAQLPGVLTTGQSVLQAPVVRAPTIYAEPTGVPLSVSNVGDRLPVQSSLSAGATQRALGTDATNRQTISPVNALNSYIATEKFNEEAEFKTDLAKLEAEQGHIAATDQAYQSAINADKQDQIRAEQREQFEEGLATREDAELAKVEGVQGGRDRVEPSQGAVATTITTNPDGSKTTNYSDGTVITKAPDGTITSATGGTARAPATRNPNSGEPGIATKVTQGANAIYSVAKGSAALLDGLVGLADKWFDESPDGAIQIGDKTITKGDFGKYVEGIKQGWTGSEGTSTTSETPTSVNGQTVIGNTTDDEGNLTGYILEDDSEVSVAEARLEGGLQDERSVFEAVSDAFGDAGLDWETLGQTAITIDNWDNLSSEQRVASVGYIGTDILENSGTIDPETADNLRTTTQGVSTLMNKNATDSQKAFALMDMAKEYTTTSYTGTVNDPRTIGGKQVVGSVATEDGQAGYQVLNTDGSLDIVPKQELVNSSNVGSALNTIAVLSSDASDTDKALALTAIGVDAAAANGIIQQANAGNTMALLSIFDTAKDWNEMNSIERGVSVLKVGDAVMQTYGNLAKTTTTQVATSTVNTGVTGAGASGSAVSTQAASSSTAGAGTSSAASTVGTVATAAAAAYGVYKGIDQAATVIEAADDMPKSESVKYSTRGLAGAGAGIGAGAGAAYGLYVGSSVGGIYGAVIGTAVGAIAGLVVGNTGTGKGSAQVGRDAWRENLDKMGVGSYKEGTSEFNVTLADGSTYDIGRDGDTKLQNRSGTNADGTPATRHTFDVDWSNEAAVASIPQAHLFAIGTGLDPTINEGKDLFHTVTAQGLNAASSNVATTSEVNENFRAMMNSANIDPRNLAMRVETMRATNSISDQEYNVYIDGINKIYGTKLQPSDRQQAYQFIVSNLEKNKDKLSDTDKKLLSTLTDKKELNKIDRSRRRRTGKEVQRLFRLPSGDVVTERELSALRSGTAIEDDQGFRRSSNLGAREVLREAGTTDEDFDSLLRNSVITNSSNRPTQSTRRV